MSYSSSSSIPSSSASSPSLGPVDSSPLSSPHPGPISLSDDLDSPPASPGVVHPFAGNTKAVKRIRLYEKSADRWGAELNDAIEDDRSFATLNLDGSMCASSEPSDTEGGDFFACDDDMDESTLADEVDPWAKAISNAIDQGNGLIDLR
ncbi:hypothetical protein EUX98_g7100 [Antrodiella citrinella]|uniref:Uncharacterized protein n=1 Tax=Antrodiella citrinella TaxID=2447956 RepID=A0A4S4MP60_9APHY|nr:hypothetical protein EUX98_g7100 [Antrodiella citrinella]